MCKSYEDNWQSSTEAKSRTACPNSRCIRQEDSKLMSRDQAGKSRQHLPNQIFVIFGRKIIKFKETKLLAEHLITNITSEKSTFIYFSLKNPLTSFKDFYSGIYVLFLCICFCLSCSWRTHLGITLWVINKARMKARLPPTVWLKSGCLQISDLLGKCAFWSHNRHCCTVLIPVERNSC